MLDNVVSVYKKYGETPLECLKKLKNRPLKVPMTYAGRLDPAAEGLIITLFGDQCHKKDEYTSLPKEYTLQILFGFSTDTYDLLGLVKEQIIPRQDLGRGINVSGEEILKILTNFTGNII